MSHHIPDFASHDAKPQDLRPLTDGELITATGGLDIAGIASQIGGMFGGQKGQQQGAQAGGIINQLLQSFGQGGQGGQGGGGGGAAG